MDVKEVGLSRVDWVNLAQDGDIWWNFVKIVMNICSINTGNFC
jgi:hypothetical protein